MNKRQLSLLAILLMLMIFTNGILIAVNKLESPKKVNQPDVHTISQIATQATLSPSAKVIASIREFIETRTGFTILILVFLLLLVLPFIPAVIEMMFPKDNEPLVIKQDYTRDPRYFDKNFLQELQPYLKDPEIRKSQEKLEGHIPIDYHDKVDEGDNKRFRHLLIVNQNLKVGNHSRFYQPVYVAGDANMGKKTELEILLARGNIKLGSDCTINQWIGTDHNISIGESSYLGKRIACDGILQLSKGCMFKSMYAMPIATDEADFSTGINSFNAVEMPSSLADNITHVSDFNWYVSRDYMTIPPYSIVNNSMIVKSDLVLRKGVVVNGDLKVYGKVQMEKDVRIYGELISDGDIEIGEDSFIRENMFSQSRILIRRGVRVGMPKQFKSVVGKKGIRIEKNVIIYGYVMTAGLGVIV